MKKFLMMLVTLSLISTSMHGTGLGSYVKMPQSVPVSTWTRITGASQTFARWLASTAHKALNINWAKTDMAKAGLYTVAAAGTIYGITWLARKIFHTSDATVAEQAEEACQNADQLTEPLFEILAYNYNNYNKSIPAILASAPKNVPLNTYINDLNKAICDIKYYEALLLKRMASLFPQIDHESEARKMYNSMQSIKQRIVNLLTALNKLHDYFEQHDRYFEQYDAKADLFYTYHINGKTSLQFLGETVYPRVHHAERLKQHAAQLEQRIERLEYNNAYTTYPYLYFAAIQLARDLSVAHERIVNIKEYAQELRALRDEEQKVEESSRQAKYREKQLEVQKQKLQESRYTNDLAALSQQKKFITPEAYQEKLRHINSMYQLERSFIY